MNVQGVEENSYIAKSNNNHSIEILRNNSSEANSYKGDFRENKHNIFPSKVSLFGDRRQNFETEFPSQNHFSIDLKRHLFYLTRVLISRG